MRDTAPPNVTEAVSASDCECASLPVLKSRFIPAYSGVVVDRSAIVSAVGPVSIATSEHSLFAADSVPLRALWRIGWPVTRPDRIGKFSVEPGS